jgi:hypothetical protein
VIEAAADASAQRRDFYSPGSSEGTIAVVPFQAAPHVFEVPFVTFEDPEEMDSREEQLAGHVVALIIAARVRREINEVGHGKPWGWNTRPSQSTQHDYVEQYLRDRR